MSGQKPREIALSVLREGGAFVEDRLDDALGASKLSPVDRHLCQELVYGIIRWRATLDWLVTRKTPPRAQKPLLQNLLRLGLYQIFWLDRIPNHAAVHETVELAKQNGFDRQAGFINAVLRGYLREMAETRQLLAELKANQPALGYSHPDWLAERWEKRSGMESAKQLMEWNNTPPKTFARINTLKTDAGKLLPQWRDEDVEYDFVRHPWLDDNLVFELKAHPPLAKLPSFQQGLFYVQDPSTLLAVRELGALPGQTVLDLCAAPGGKLTYLAQTMRNEGRIVAHDLSPDRLELIQTNCVRLGVSSVEPVLSPALDDMEPALFDHILIDAPCSNTGVMRRRVELRWRIRPEEISRLAKSQLELLQRAGRLLKPGGTLVYSTCSLEPEENERVIEQFLRAHPEFLLEGVKELLPFRDQVDGAYVARLRLDSQSRK